MPVGQCRKNDRFKVPYIPILLDLRESLFNPLVDSFMEDGFSTRASQLKDAFIRGRMHYARSERFGSVAFV